MCLLLIKKKVDKVGFEPTNSERAFLQNAATTHIRLLSIQAGVTGFEPAFSTRITVPHGRNVGRLHSDIVAAVEVEST